MDAYEAHKLLIIDNRAELNTISNILMWEKKGTYKIKSKSELLQAWCIGLELDNNIQGLNCSKIKIGMSRTYQLTVDGT